MPSPLYVCSGVSRLTCPLAGAPKTHSSAALPPSGLGGGSSGRPRCTACETSARISLGAGTPSGLMGILAARFISGSLLGASRLTLAGQALTQRGRLSPPRAPATRGCGGRTVPSDGPASAGPRAPPVHLCSTPCLEPRVLQWTRRVRPSATGRSGSPGSGPLGLPSTPREGLARVVGPTQTAPCWLMRRTTWTASGASLGGGARSAPAGPSG